MFETHKRVAFVSAGALLLSAAGGVFSPIAAHAEPEAPSGAYNYLAHDRDSAEERSATWTFTSCGTGCVKVDGWPPVAGAEFRLNGGQWTYNGRTEAQCMTGGPWPTGHDVRFDATTLAGEWVVTSLGQCGNAAPGTVGGDWLFQLTKI